MYWITSEKGQFLIGQFKVSGKVLFTPNAATVAKLSKVEITTK
jgi:ABC-type tungstate transport system permease subunit